MIPRQRSLTPLPHFKKGSEMELVRKEDIAKLSCLNHLVLSPDQETAVFTEITPDLKENKEHRNLYVLVPETGKVSRPKVAKP